MSARYYDADTGRFLLQDTYRREAKDSGTWNLHVYCASDPVNYVDPTEHWFETLFDVVNVVSSAVDFVKKPSLANIEYLAWDVASVVAPGVPGSYVAKGAKVASKVAKKAAGKTISRGTWVVKKVSKGGSSAKTFKILDWTGYPNATKPKGPFKIIEGVEYKNARKLANNTNAKIHKEYSHLDGVQIHEMHPVKFGGSSTDIDNKIALTQKEHAEYTKFWNRIYGNRKERNNDR